MLIKARLALVVMLSITIAAASATPAYGLTEVRFTFVASGPGKVIVWTYDEYTYERTTLNAIECIEAEMSSACVYEAPQAQIIEVYAEPRAAGDVFLSWDTPIEGCLPPSRNYCDLSVGSGGWSIAAVFGAARKINVSIVGPGAVGLSDPDFESVGGDYNQACPWEHSPEFADGATCTLYASPLNDIVLSAPPIVGSQYGSWGGDCSFTKLRSGQTSRCLVKAGTGVVNVTLTAKSETLTLIAPRDGTLSILNYNGTEVFQCVGPATCIAELNEFTGLERISLATIDDWGADSQPRVAASVRFAGADGHWARLTAGNCSNSGLTGEVLQSFPLDCYLRDRFGASTAPSAEQDASSSVVTGQLVATRVIGCVVTAGYGGISAFGFAEREGGDGRDAACASQELVLDEDTGSSEIVTDASSVRGPIDRSIRLVATPQFGWMFGSWGGSCSGAKKASVCILPPGSSGANATASFVPRATLSNRSVLLGNSASEHFSGGKFSWYALGDDEETVRYRSSGWVTIPASGTVKIARVIGGEVTGLIKDGLFGSDWVANGAVSLSLDAGAVSPNLFSQITPPLTRRVRVRVVTSLGTPMPGVKVSTTTSSCQSGAWRLKAPKCRLTAVTDLQGSAYLEYVDDEEVTPGLSAEFLDVDLLESLDEFVLDTDGQYQFTFTALPNVAIESEETTVSFGSLTVVSAIARGSDGRPLSGRTLTLGTKTTGASASCSGRKTTAVTNSAGRATFKVCPVKTATWSVDGRSIVGSEGVRLAVQLTPTSPRTLTATPKTRSVSLAWVVPVKVNASAVTDYIVQYRLQGATTWVTFRDGTSTARKATVTGLTSGQVYEFRVAAKNKAGTGTWSGVVLGTSK
jgi:hypothetical protein